MRTSTLRVVPGRVHQNRPLCGPRVWAHFDHLGNIVFAALDPRCLQKQYWNIKKQINISLYYTVTQCTRHDVGGVQELQNRVLAFPKPVWPKLLKLASFGILFANGVWFVGCSDSSSFDTRSFCSHGSWKCFTRACFDDCQCKPHKANNLTKQNNLLIHTSTTQANNSCKQNLKEQAQPP